MKKIFIVLLSLISMFPVYAEETTEKIDKNLYEAGENVVVDGTYDGISFVAGADLKVNTNSLFGALAGQNITFNGTVEKDLFIAGATLEIDGYVKRDVYAAGQEIKITGVIDGNVYVFSEKLVISDNAIIKGNIKFNGSELENNGSIAGKVTYYENTITSGLENIETSILNNPDEVTIKDEIIDIGYSLLRYLFVFMLITFMFPKLLKRINEKYSFNNLVDYLSTAGTGIISMFVFPIIAILLLISNIGLSVGLIMVAMYIIMIYLTTIVSGYVFGNVITNRIIKKGTNDYISGLLGITSIVILSYIPYIGTLVSMISVLFGFGIIIKMLTNRENRTL